METLKPSIPELQTGRKPVPETQLDKVLGNPHIFAELVKETPGWWVNKNTDLWEASYLKILDFHPSLAALLLT